MIITLTFFYVLFTVATMSAFSSTRIINIFKNILSKVFSFIKNRVFNLMLSLLLFILLLLPFKLILPLLNLSYILPIISGFYACIFIISFIDDKKDLFNIIQLLYTFTIAVTLGYIALWCKQFELIYYLFAFMPLFAEIGTNELSLRLSSSIALFMEGSDKGSDKNSPILSNSPFDFNTPSPTGTPIPPTFAQILWSRRYDSFDDAKRLDLAKRILLRKILDDMSARLGKNIPNEVQQCIQDNVWGNHWYDLYTKHDRFRKTRNTAIGTYFKSTWEKKKKVFMAIFFLVKRKTIFFKGPVYVCSFAYLFVIFFLFVL